ncbi:UvrD-helicase domain-containing protein [Clostridium sp.]|uniref:HelD family protein n=1 Tax=Clostridium sp. TaxID=1506 RepID=UPI0025BB4EA9|nr:UvrD-helicase domain-containing protein [Clostridium sp.]
MEIKRKLIEEESKILDDKLSLIKNEIINNDKLIKDYSLQDINTYQKVDQNKYNKAIKEQENLKDSIYAPYYGRLDIEYNEENEKEIIYIGRRSIDINGEPIIYSWAAPIAEIYEMYNSGEYKHKYVDKNSGKEIILEGDIKTKRKISINNSKVIDVYSYTNYTEKDEEEFVKAKIETNKTEKLGVIIETVQKDQNKIIRLPIEKNIIVQGCAGSGKSSVAFHRLAYLSYNYKLKEDEILVISPNKVFQGYTSNILTELGNDFNVRQFTFKEFAEEILQVKFEDRSNIDDEISMESSQIKTRKSFKVILDNYVSYIQDNFIPKENIVIDDFELINSIDLNCIWYKQFGTYKLNDRIERFKVYLEKYLKEKTEEYIKLIEKRYNSNIEILQKYNKNPITYNEIVKLTRDEQVIRIKRLKKQCLTIINGYINNLSNLSAVNLYKNLLNDRELLNKLGGYILSKREIDIISSTFENSINNIDYIPILYLYYNLNENKNKYRHIVIDECQDLSYIEIAVIEGLTKSFTLVGDFNQRVNLNKSTVSLAEINEMFKKYTFFESYCLNKSFRNSMSITKYANAILEEYFISKESIPVAFNRETEKPKVYLKMDKKHTIKAIANNINSKINKDKNIAVILKNESSAREYYNELSKLLNDKTINLIDNEYCKYEKGINVLSARLSKGLEFDYVIIVNAELYENNEEDRRLLYIATTRALHDLDIYTESKDSFITTIDNKLWDSKFKLATNDMNKQIKSVIINTLTNGFGELPKEYINYINSIESLIKLTEFMNKLDGLEDINKLFEEEGITLISNNNINEDEKTLEEVSVTLESKSKVSYLDKLIKDIENKKMKVTGKQLDVYEYIINNIIELPKFKNCRDLSNKLGVSTTTITMLLLKLNLGSYGNFISVIKECIKKDSKR